jgi:hypothetical protein
MNIDRQRPDFVNWKGGQLNAKFKCVHCNKHLKEPVKLQCNHHICSFCLKELKKFLNSFLIVI